MPKVTVVVGLDGVVHLAHEVCDVFPPPVSLAEAAAARRIRIRVVGKREGRGVEIVVDMDAVDVVIFKDFGDAVADQLPRLSEAGFK